MTLPRLEPSTPKDARTDSVVLAVYAPFGTDEVLSTYPDGSAQELAQHPLFKSMVQVAEQQVHVVALIDRADDDTHLLEIPAGRAAALRVTSRWKQDMGAPATLAGFLRHVRAQHPTSAVVLALEGHGAGFLPELDRRQLSARNVTANGEIEWHLTHGQASPVLPMGAPVLPMGAPVLPMGAPVLPVNHLPLSTWGLGDALRAALDGGVPRLSAVHFNNCFNMSVELLHTIAPHAEFATGYMNYNFFTAGTAYPAVFARLRQAGSASAEQLAQWFADENRAALAAKGHHPTTGGVVKLARLQEIVERIDDLADALLAVLRGASAGDRPSVVNKIRHAIVRAQQFDTGHSQSLETPDELTDIHSFAAALQTIDFGASPVHAAAAALSQALQGIKRYGDNEAPWTDPGVTWDFSEPTLAMNIFLPDPLLRGLWDWRSPYYLDVNPDPALPRVQPHIIDFVKVTDWVDFLIEYHKEVPFKGLLPASIPEFPVFNARYVPPKDRPRPDPRKPC